MSKFRSPADLLDDTLTVGRMIELLQQFDEFAPLVVSSDYGDLVHTEQIHNVGDCDVKECLESDMKESGYSRSGIAFDSYFEPEGGGADDDREVVVIRI